MSAPAQGPASGGGPAMPAASRPLRLVGCGILQKEIDQLIRERGWSVEPRYLDSALHNYLGRLEHELRSALQAEDDAGRETVVFYGCCHPRMDVILEEHGTLRTAGQNCVSMLLGPERFARELERGTYFLLEEWALRWEPLISACFGPRPEVVREIFHASHKQMLAVRTPCSGDFTAAAETAAASVDLPLLWTDASLEPLEHVLADALQRRRGASR